MLDDTQTACFQAGTNGGQVVSASSFTVVAELVPAERRGHGRSGRSAESPGLTGSFNFAVTTSANPYRRAPTRWLLVLALRAVCFLRRLGGQCDLHAEQCVLVLVSWGR